MLEIEPDRESLPLLMPLGDAGLLVRFGATLSDAANQRAIAFARRLRAVLPDGVVEIDPNLVSVLLKFDPGRIDFDRLAGEVRLRLAGPEVAAAPEPITHRIEIAFGGDNGPDLAEVAGAVGFGIEAFIATHNAVALRVLTTGFAPGFVYCGFHPNPLRLPRRRSVKPSVAPGSILFAAGQTAITSTTIPTGWHVIGRTTFRNFDPAAMPPTRLREGDLVQFVAVSP